MKWRGTVVYFYLLRSRIYRCEFLPTQIKNLSLCISAYSDQEYCTVAPHFVDTTLNKRYGMEACGTVRQTNSVLSCFPLGSRLLQHCALFYLYFCNLAVLLFTGACAICALNDSGCILCRTWFSFSPWNQLHLTLSICCYKWSGTCTQ